MTPFKQMTPGQRMLVFLESWLIWEAEDIDDLLHESGLKARPIPTWWASVARCPECLVLLPLGLRCLDQGACCPACGMFFADQADLGAALPSFPKKNFAAAY